MIVSKNLLFMIDDPTFYDYLSDVDYYIEIFSDHDKLNISIDCHKTSIFKCDFNNLQYQSFREQHSNTVSIIKKQNDILCEIYSARTSFFLSFLIDFNGNIKFSFIDDNSLLNSFKLAFKTNNCITNTVPTFFNYFIINCKHFYNYSVLYLREFAFFTDYIFNTGIISRIESSQNISLNFSFKRFSFSSPQESTFENKGGFFCNNISVLSHTNIINNGIIKVNDMYIQNGNILNNLFFDINGSLVGNVDNFVLSQKGFSQIGEINLELIQKLKNSGSLLMDSSSELIVNTLENNGLIFADKSLDFKFTDILSPEENTIIAQDILNISLINDFKNEEIKKMIEGKYEKENSNDQKEIQRKIIGSVTAKTVKIYHIIDYYLNTITDHYIIKNGRRIFVKRTETGYIWQKRDTKVEEKESLISLGSELKKITKLMNKKKSYFDELINEIENDKSFLNSFIPFFKDKRLPNNIISSNPYFIAKLHRESAKVSFKSILPKLTLYRYQFQNFLDRHPTLCKTTSFIYDCIKTALMTFSAIPAIILVPQTAGFSLIKYACTFFGIPSLINYSSNYVLNKIAPILSEKAASGDKCLCNEYNKTIHSIGNMITDIGIIYTMGRFPFKFIPKNQSKIHSSYKNILDRYNRFYKKYQYQYQNHIYDIEKIKNSKIISYDNIIIKKNAKGYPIFDEFSKFDVKIDPRSTKYTRYNHAKLATKALKSAIESNQVPKDRFSKIELDDIFNEKVKIGDNSWHHHQDYGRMQLIPTIIHMKTKHEGGFRLWKDY